MMENMNIMNENIVLKFIEQERQESKLTNTEKNLIEANTKLVDENRVIKEELKRLYGRIDKAKEEIRKRSTEEVADLYIKILEGEEYEK